MRLFAMFAALAMCLGPPAAMASVAAKANDLNYSSTATIPASSAEVLPERAAVAALIVGGTDSQHSDSIDRVGTNTNVSAPRHYDPG